MWKIIVQDLYLCSSIINFLCIELPVFQISWNPYMETYALRWSWLPFRFHLCPIRRLQETLEQIFFPFVSFLLFPSFLPSFDIIRSFWRILYNLPARVFWSNLGCHFEKLCRSVFTALNVCRWDRFIQFHTGPRSGISISNVATYRHVFMNLFLYRYQGISYRKGVHVCSAGTWYCSLNFVSAQL
jgi:hypothetical protein